MADSAASAADLAVGPNPYETLGLTPGDPAAGVPPPTDADVRRAFRKLALTKHPDKQPDNPKAAEEFDAIQKAHAALSDPAARSAWDDLLAARAAREARLHAAGDKRRRMAADLEAREKAGARAPSAVDAARARLAAELERVRRSVAAAEEAKWAAAAAAAPKQAAPAPASSAAQAADLSRTVKVSWDLAAGDYTAAELTAALGGLEAVADVVLRPAKRRGAGSALVVLSSAAAASAALESPANGAHGPLLVLPLAKAGSGVVPGAAARAPAPAPARPPSFAAHAPPPDAGRPAFAAGARANAPPAAPPVPAPPPPRPSAAGHEADTLARLRAAAAAAKRRLEGEKAGQGAGP